MTLLDSSFTPPIEQAHPGGFFMCLERSQRIETLLSLATRVKGMIVIAGSVGEARSVSERLTLRGVPVLLGSNVDERQVAHVLDSKSTTALITTSEFIDKCGPVRSPLTVHLRPPLSSRSYAKRLRSALSAVHVTFVTPEDEQRAGQLRLSLSHNEPSIPNESWGLSGLIDLSKSDEAAAVHTPRRRFPFRSI